MKENREKKGEMGKMAQSCEETIALEERLENPRKIKKTGGE